MRGKSETPAPSEATTVAQIIRVYRDVPTSEGASGSNPTNKPLRAVSIVNEEVKGKRLRNNRFDYPVVVNPAVEQWIDYFTGKGRVHFEKYLQRSRYFIPTISKVLKANNMPQDLVYLAMIESGFNNVARSQASAVGPWQFIKGTGRRYGLTINYWMDERRDTSKSTMAAISYLKELYQEFGSWEVAAASYNAGENKLRHAIARYRTRDFWELSHHRFLRSETRHYVPKIMAAAILTKNPELFGFEDPFNEKNPNPTLNDNGEPTPKELGEEVAAVQPATNGAAPTLDEDIAMEEDEDDDSEDGPGTDAFASVVSDQPSPGAASSMYMVANPNEQVVEFEVKGPADLFAVAKAAGVPFSTVKLLNPELLRWCTPPSYKTYRIKLPLSSKDAFLASYNNDNFERKVTFAQYKVRRGDTVSYVARRFLTQPDPIRELNQLSTRENRLRAGADIILPIPTGYKRVIASLYDEKPMPSRRRRRRGRRHRYHAHHSSAARRIAGRRSQASLRE